MPVLCIDIGNTRFHTALVEGREVTACVELPTEELGFRAPMLLTQPGIDGVAYCSVVPEATAQLEAGIHATDVPKPFRLDAEHCPGLIISYPKPAEIGPDRLANAIGAQIISGAPAVVIDTGTATTFDLLTASQGYIGGIIAPGPAMMTRYLHEKTALLPSIPLEELTEPAKIGVSTRDAMKIGCVVGFAGMIQALLDRSHREFIERGELAPGVLATGGGTVIWRDHFDEPLEFVAHLSLLGLAEAWRRAHGND